MFRRVSAINPMVVCSKAPLNYKASVPQTLAYETTRNLDSRVEEKLAFQADFNKRLNNPALSLPRQMVRRWIEYRLEQFDLQTRIILRRRYGWLLTESFESPKTMARRPHREGKGGVDKRKQKQIEQKLGKALAELKKDPTFQKLHSNWDRIV